MRRHPWWALYGLSAAGVIRRLPLLRPALAAICVALVCYAAGAVRAHTEGTEAQR